MTSEQPGSGGSARFRIEQPARGRSAPMPTGIAAGLGFAGAIVATTVAVLLGSTHQPIVALIPLGLVTAAIAGTTSWAGALATAWICWSLDAGFVVGREAQLTFSPEAGLAALVLVTLALLAGVAGRTVRSVHRSQLIQSAKDRLETRS